MKNTIYNKNIKEYERGENMYKIAILGCENSHANQFIELIKKDKKFSDVEVVGVYSDDEAALKALADKYQLYAMKSYDEFVGQLDGVMVTARHGNNHLKYVEPYLSSKIAVFVDKPITISISDALSLAKQLEEYGNRFTGGSMLKFSKLISELKKDVKKEAYGKTIGGLVRAPLSLENEYGGFYFYSQHLVEMVCEVFGRFPKSVQAVQNDVNVTVIFRYDNYDITGVFTGDAWVYSATRLSVDKTYGDMIVLSDESKKEFEEFYNCLKDKGEQMDVKEFISPVFILNAIEKSLESGKEEKISWL